jgi:hypothetical protein
MNFSQQFIADVVKRMRYYKSLGDKTFAQLEERDFFFQPNEESNSIAMIVQHLHGNMTSRFTNFLTEDGEKPWRNRDAEFEALPTSKAQLQVRWETGWATVFNAIEPLKEEDLLKEITIRSEKLYVYDALLRQLAHFPYHVGQIVYIGKMIKDTAWENLSVPKGGSKEFNKAMQDGK